MVTPITKKRRILFFIPLIIVGAILFYSWFIFIFSDNIPSISHYLGLIFFLPILYFLFKSKTLKQPIILTGIYLVLATINILSFFPFLFTSSLKIAIGSHTLFTPGINGFALLILIIYGALNFDTLVDIYLDYKETKGKL
jgi:hypothetical protein